MRYCRAIIVAILLTPCTVSALSLDQALILAREQATTLDALRADTRQAEAVYQQSSQVFLPTLSADASWLRADSALITNVPVPAPTNPSGIQQTDLGPVEGTLTGVQVTQPLYNADAWKKREAASLNAKARRQSERWGRQALRLEVARQYFNVQRLREQQAAAKQSRVAAAEAARLAEASYQQGLSARIDREQADAELAASRARVARANAATERAEIQLKSLLGMAPQATMGEMSPMPRPQPPADTGHSAPRLDLKARQLAVNAAEARAGAAEADWMPRVNLLARQQWAHGDSLLEDNGDSWLIAVNLRWTLFDGLGRQGRIAESRALADKARTELESTRRRIGREQAIAVSQWQAGYTAWQAAAESASAAERASQLASRRYEEGIGSMTDLLVARARRDSERAALIDSRYQALLAGMNYHLQNGRDPLLALETRRP